MKLFLKHLFRSMRQRPLQPILLILSLSLAIATAIFNYSIEEALDEETKIAQAEGYGSSDLLIELTGSSKSRFMFASDINELLGEEVASVGCLELPVFFGESRETVFGVATDFENVDKQFTLFTNEIFLPKILVDAGIVKSSSEVKRNKT